MGLGITTTVLGCKTLNYLEKIYRGGGQDATFKQASVITFVHFIYYM